MTSDYAETADTASESNPTEQQLAAWKQEHGKIKLVEVDGLQIYFKQPTRELVKQATDAMIRAKGSVSRYNDIILKNCQLNYQKATAEDVELYFALTQVVDNIVTGKVATLKNE